MVCVTYCYSLFFYPPLWYIINRIYDRYVIVLMLVICLGMSLFRELTINDVGLLYFSKAATRAPAYIMGLCIGKFVKEERSVDAFPLLVFMAFYIIYRMVFKNCLMYWVYTPVILIFLCLLLSKQNTITSFLSFMGIISLESYLANFFLGDVCNYLSWRVGEIDLSYGHYVEYSLVVVGGFIWAVLTYKLKNKIYAFI